jgi:hypothetical protein
MVSVACAIAERQSRLVTSRRSRRIVVAALLVPLAMIVGLRSAWALYACRIDGQVRSSCCCEGKHERHTDSQTPIVKAASCCEVTIQSPASAPQVRDADRSDLKAPPTVVTTISAETPARPIARAMSIDRPAARPPPVATFLIKQSFLR